MPKRRYTQYPRHADNTGEIISSNDVNELQKELEAQQRDLFDLRDVDFHEKVLFVLKNHTVVNTAFVDKLDDDNHINKETGEQLTYSENEKGIAFFSESEELEDTIAFKEIFHRKGLAIVKVILMEDSYQPDGTTIEYQISNNGVDFYTIVPNQSQVLNIPSNGKSLILRAKFKRNSLTKSPRLDAWALLYEDTSYTVKLYDGHFDFGDVDGGKYSDVKEHYHAHSELLDIGPDDHHPQEHSHDGTDGSGLISHFNLTDIGEDDHHPKNHRHGQDGVDKVNLETDVSGMLGYQHIPQSLITGLPGQLILYRNPELADRVIRAKGPDEDVFLVYDDEGYLDRVVTVYREVATIETMSWANYEYADGTEIRTLMGTDKVVKDIQATEIQEVLTQIKSSTSKPPMI